jgi:hypothetical protein
MTTEFKIDRPGVYRRRDGKLAYLWPTFSLSQLRWFALFAELPASYKSNGAFWISGEEASFDIVAYVGPLPVDVLQRVREALALAEGDEPQSPTVEQRLRHKCRVCGEWPNERGVLHHGRGCYVTHKGGGGCTYVDFEQEPKQ